jgi:hypothetical protein
VRSIYAVVGQMVISASNYGVFVVLARKLSVDSFVAFSTAVGLNILAWAIAEGGVSYVAPRELATPAGRGQGRTAGAFLTLSVGLYVVAMMVGFFVWNFFAEDSLDPMWVGAYAAYTLPALLIPPWITCWSLDAPGLAAIVVARTAIVVGIVRYPGASTLGVSGVAFFGFVVFLVAWLNRDETVVRWANVRAIRVAIRSLSHVFLAKTMSYAIYGLAPMMIGVTRGGLTASDYVTGERMKALYATLFQPAIQTVYLAQFQPGAGQQGTRSVEIGVHAGNVILGLAVIGAIDLGALRLLGERFDAVQSVQVYVFAACLSVASAAVLYFRVFPSGDFRVFRRATLIQMVTFMAMFVTLGTSTDLPVSWVLGIGEGVLLVALLGQILRTESRSVGPHSDR